MNESEVQSESAHVSRAVEEWLTKLQHEMRCAMSSISNHDRTGLEQSIKRQQDLCGELRPLMDRLLRNPEPSGMEGIKHLTLSVRQSSRTYRLLLEQVGANARQMYRLCQSYTV